jgi:hypothetical protein
MDTIPNPDLAEVFRSALEHAEELPIHRRIHVYRGLAQICGDRREEERLNSLASVLMASEKLCREFKFSFRQKNPFPEIKS